MKSLLFLSVILFPFLAMSSVSNGNHLSGNKLYLMCQSGDKKVLGACIGYMLGVIDSYLWINDKEEQSCLSKNLLSDDIEVSQVVEIAIKYLKDNPQIRNHAANKLVIDSLYDALGCPKSSSPFKPE